MASKKVVPKKSCFQNNMPPPPCRNMARESLITSSPSSCWPGSSWPCNSLHNLADGLALGASISQSLSQGISTIIFHETPHELGDFFILLSMGMSWCAALAFNFISALTAIVGVFCGRGPLGQPLHEWNFHLHCLWSPPLFPLPPAPRANSHEGEIVQAVCAVCDGEIFSFT